MATQERFDIKGDPTKPYVLYRTGANEEIIECIADGDSVEDLFKAHRRRLNWKYAVYRHGERISYRAGGKNTRLLCFLDAAPARVGARP